MKSSLQLVSLCCLLALRVHSQDSPDLFSSDKSELPSVANSIPITTNEFLPAKFDQNGHWGDVVAGFQMSIRSTNDVFVIGRPAPVAVILRNTTTNTLKRIKPEVGNEVYFHIEDESGRNLSFIPSSLSLSPLVGLGGMQQVRYEYDLDTGDLAPGTYKFKAYQLLFRTSDEYGNRDLTNVASAVLSIKVIQK